MPSTVCTAIYDGNLKSRDAWEPCGKPPVASGVELADISKKTAASLTSGVGSRADAEGDRPPGLSPAGILQVGMVEMDVPGGTRPS